MTNATKENDVDAGSSEGTAKAAEGVQAVVFALNILEFMARQSEAIGVTDLATAFGTTKSRIFRHLRTLLLQGYIVQDDAGRYKVGTRLVALGNSVMRNFDLVQVSAATMRALRDRVGSSVVLCHSEDEGVRVLSVVQGQGQSQIEITVRPGSLMGFHASAQGKVSLAFGQPELLARLLSKPLVAHSPQTIVDAAQLKDELAKVRRQGWASAPNQAVTGLNAVAAPLFDAAGVLIGTLAVVDSVQFLPEPPPPALLQQLTGAAQAISASLGYIAP